MSRCGGGGCSIPRRNFYSSENLKNKSESSASSFNCVFLFVSFGPNIDFGYILLKWHLNIEETRTLYTWPFVHGGRRTCAEVSVSLLCFLNRGHICSFAESTQKNFLFRRIAKNIKTLHSVENFNVEK